jgi:hypothetical protein
MSMPIRKIRAINAEADATRQKDVFITWFWWSDVGKYRTTPLLKPSRPKVETSVTTDIRVVAIPTCSDSNNLALMIQKQKPTTAITAVLNIR